VIVAWHRSSWHEDPLSLGASAGELELDVFPATSSRNTWLWVIRNSEEIIAGGSAHNIHAAQTDAERRLAKEIL